MSLRAEQVELTRRRLVETFVELSGRPGAAPATMAEVARASGVSPATLYRHFPRREALVHAAATDRLTLGVDEEVAEWSLEHLRAHLAALWTELAHNMALTREGAVSEAGRELRATRFDTYRHRFAEALAHQGADPSDPTTRRCAASIALLSSVHTFLDLVDRQGLQPDEAAETATWAIDAVVRSAGVDPHQLRVDGGRRRSDPDEEDR